MAQERRTYHAIGPVSSEDAEAAFLRNDPAELLLIAIGVGLHCDDLAWAERFCLRLAEHPHYNVRGNAILALGHLSRRFRTLELPASVNVVRRGLTDADAFVRGQAEAAADDVEWFAKLPGRPPGIAI